MKKTKMIRKIFILALLMAMTSQLASCGRKSSPIPPPDNEYPRHYPAK